MPVFSVISDTIRLPAGFALKGFGCIGEGVHIQPLRIASGHSWCEHRCLRK